MPDLTRSQTLPPLLLTFFAQFLGVWDGSHKRDIVLETLSFAPVMEFEGTSHSRPP
jgi:centromere protein I